MQWWLRTNQKLTTFPENPLRHSKLKYYHKTIKSPVWYGGRGVEYDPPPFINLCLSRNFFGNSGCLQGITFLSCLFSGFQDKIPLAPSTEWHCKCSNHILRVYSVNKAFDLTLHIHTIENQTTHIERAKNENDHRWQSRSSLLKNRMYHHHYS